MRKPFKALTPKPAKARSARAAPTPPSQPKTGTGAGTAPDGRTREIGGPDGPEPTRYGDWERGGICYDF